MTDMINHPRHYQGASPRNTACLRMELSFPGRLNRLDLSEGAVAMTEERGMGENRIQKRCPECKGEGRKMTFLLRFWVPIMEGPIAVDCPSCQGEGWVTYDAAHGS